MDITGEMSGKFITFEGIEGCGKTTQIGLLENVLTAQGIAVARTKEPGGTPIGTKIREILLSTRHQGMDPLTELFLYVADRRQHIQEIILPALEEGKIVLCDRFADATTAYQGAGRNIPIGFLKMIHEPLIADLKPDLTLLFDLPVELAMRRIQSRRLDRLEKEEQSFHERVRQEYLKIAKAEPERICIIDATKPIEAIHQEVFQMVKQRCGLKQ